MLHVVNRDPMITPAFLASVIDHPFDRIRRFSAVHIFIAICHSAYSVIANVESIGTWWDIARTWHAYQMSAFGVYFVVFAVGVFLHLIVNIIYDLGAMQFVLVAHGSGAPVVSLGVSTALLLRESVE